MKIGNAQRASRCTREFIALNFAVCALFITLLLPAHALHAGKIFRIGFLDASTAAGNAALIEAVQQELSRLGWIRGKNITIEYRFGENKGADDVL